jgi:uncharacterized protein YybS (DUF2232 family)
MGSLPLGYEAGLVNAGIFALTVVAPGLAMGYASRTLSSPAKAVIYGLFPILVFLVIISFFYAAIMRDMSTTMNQINASVTKIVSDSPNFSRMIAAQYGAGADGQQKFLAEMDRVIEFFLKIMPGTLFAGFLAILVISLGIAGSLAPRLRLIMPRFKPFYLWRANDWWLLPTVLGLALVVVAKNDLWRYLGGNVLMISGNVYAVVGLAVTEAFLKRFNVPSVVRMIFYVLMILTSVLGLVFFALLGIADSRFNFKRETLDREDKNMG